MSRHPNPRALVTGASSPIGAAIAEALAEDGHRLILQANRNLAAAEAVAEAVRARGGVAEAVALDLTDPAASDRLAEMATAEPVQVLVHAAGGQRDKPFAAMDRADWTDILDINLTSFFAAAQPLMLPMMRTRWGRIVAVSSLSGVIGNRGQANYAAAKAGLHAAIKSIAREYGRRGITANAVAPGLIDTPETRTLANWDELVRLCPAGRAGTCEEVAATIRFLISPKAGYCSGQVICLDGGSG